MADRTCSPDIIYADEIARLTEADRRRTAAARATYREQVKAEALHLEAIQIAAHADLMGLTGELRISHIEHHMATLSAAEIDALTNTRMRAIMAARGRASALARRTRRLEKLRGRRAAGDAA